MIPIKTYAYIGAGLAFIALFTAYRLESAKVKERTAERDAAVASVQALTIAASGKDETITALKASVEAWKKLTTPAADTKAAADRLNAAAEQLNARARALSSREEAERASKPCAQVLAIDLAASCPAHADAVRMRQRAAGSFPRPSSGSAGSGR